MLDLPAQPCVDATGYEPVEFLDGFLPCERMGSETRIVLNLVLDHGPVSQMDRDLCWHFPRVLSREFVVRTDRNLLQQRLHIGPDDAVRLELCGRHLAIDEGNRKQVRQAVIRLFLGTDDFVHAVKTAAGEVESELEHPPSIETILLGSIFLCLVNSTMQ